METVVCWSWYVVNTWLFLVGITVLRGISLVITPPTAGQQQRKADTLCQQDSHREFATVQCQCSHLNTELPV
jgi:hypothetical protein